MRKCTLFVLSSIVALACGSSVAADEESAAQRCDDLRDAIMSSLQAHVDSGALLSSAAPCGEDGIANGGGSFHERVSEAEIDGVRRDFAAACDEYEASCVRDL